MNKPLITWASAALLLLPGCSSSGTLWVGMYQSANPDSAWDTLILRANGSWQITGKDPDHGTYRPESQDGRTYMATTYDATYEAANSEPASGLDQEGLPTRGPPRHSVGTTAATCWSARPASGTWSGLAALHVAAVRLDPPVRGKAISGT